MASDETTLLLARLRLETVDGGFQAELDGRHYKISARFHEGLSQVQALGWEAGLQRLAERWQMSASQLPVLHQELSSALQALKTSEPKSPYIHGAFTVVPERWVCWAAGHLQHLFARWLVLLTLLAGAWVMADWLVFHQVGNSQLRSLDLSLSDWLLGYACLAVMLLFHEFGHASGLRRVGQRPKEIGFGFFLIFPVFFANVSNAWLVERRQRVVVNLGGIYFQLLAAVLLYAGIALSSGHTQAWMVLAFKANLGIAMFVLIPFIRNDGYWLLVDALAIEDLYQRAGGMCWIVYQRLRRGQVVSREEWFIAGYAVCNYAFLLLVSWGLLKSLIGNFRKTASVVDGAGWQGLALEHPSLLLSTLLTVLLIGFFSRPFLARAYQYVKP